MSDDVTSSQSSKYFGSNQLMALLALAESTRELSQQAIARVHDLPRLQKPATMGGLQVILLALLRK